MISDNHDSNARHETRAAQLIAHEAARWIHQEAGVQSLITVTRASLEARGTHATVYVSVFPESEIRAALAFLARSEREFALHLREHSRVRPIPAVQFLLEDGSANQPPASTIP